MNTEIKAATLNKPPEFHRGLLTGPKLLENMFPDKTSRPSLRWLREQQKRRTIPYIKWGKLVFFDVPQVRAALEKRHTVKARGA